MPNRLHCLLLLLSLCQPFAVSAGSTEPAGPSNGEPTNMVVLSGNTYRVEIATTAAQRARGLMYRRHMDADQGMLFLFPKARPLTFWMKNTEIPLDILFFDDQHRLMRIHHHVPPCRRPPCAQYPSGAPSALVLELAGGTAKAADIRLGTSIKFLRPPPSATK